MIIFTISEIITMGFEDINYYSLRNGVNYLEDRVVEPPMVVQLYLTIAQAVRSFLRLVDQILPNS